MGICVIISFLSQRCVVYEIIKNMPEKGRQEWIWDKIIYANPIKANETLYDPVYGELREGFMCRS